MFRKLMARWWRTTAAVLLLLIPMGTVLAQGWQGNAPDVNWVNPNAMSMKDAGAVDGLAQSEDAYHINYDCQPRMYRMSYELFGSPLRPGCFTATAFGFMDITNGTVEGFGSDGALQLKPPTSNETIIPLLKEATFATLVNAPLLGAYMHLYDFNAPQLGYDWTGTPYLQLPEQPSSVVIDAWNNPVLMNPQSIAFSTSGSWLVVESPWHAWLRINIATMEILPFAEPLTGTAYDPALHNAQVAISDDGRYVAVQSDEFNSFKVYDLKTCTGTPAADLKPLDCQVHDYSSYVASQAPGWHLTRHLRFVNDTMLEFHATGDSGDHNYVLAPTGSITNLTDYLALGDSYTSGEGAFNYLAGTDVANSNMCHLSGNSYPLLLTRDLFNDGHSVACSGAVIYDVHNQDPNYKGQISDGVRRQDQTEDSIAGILSSFTPGTISQHEFVQHYQPRILTVSVGGDDIGFGDIIATCVSPVKQAWPPQSNPNTCYSTYEDRLEVMNKINTTYSDWVRLYEKLKNMAPNTRVYAIGYPQITAANGDCGLNVHLDASEVEFSHELIDYLNSIIESAAKAAGVTYIGIDHALDGHRLCEAGSNGIAMNGLSAGTDKFHVLGKESYHPNALGQELIEQAILKQTHNFSDEPAPASNTGTITTPAVPSDNPLLSVPKSGRTVNIWVPDTSITDSLVVRGNPLVIHIDGLTDSLSPSSDYSVKLKEDGVTVGSLASDGNGDLTGTVTLPTTVSIGEQVLEVTGQNQAGRPIDVSKTVYIADNDNDYDGDDILNSQDSCPTTANSGVDTDQDSIDDACDSFIGLTVTPNSGGQQPTPRGDGSQSTTGYNTSQSSTPVANLASTISSTSTAYGLGSSTAIVATTMRIMPSSGSVLGASTAANNQRASGSATFSASRLVRINPKTIWWQPWAIDTGLVLLLLMLLSSLFRRIAERQG